jgi:hypothetical protein
MSDNMYAETPSMVLLTPSHQEMLELNEALMKSIKASPAMNTSTLDIMSDETLNDKGKEAMLEDNLKVLLMQRDVLVERIDKTRHELDLMHKDTMKLLTEAE